MQDFTNSYFEQILNRIKIKPSQQKELLKQYEAIRPPPQFFDTIYQSLDEAKDHILQLKPNWDGEGGKPYQKSTFDKVDLFIKELAFRLWMDNEKKIPPPKIRPGPDGSIDIHWKTPQFELLMNIPVSDNEPADIYGDNYKDLVLKGTFRLTELVEVLGIWLKNHL